MTLGAEIFPHMKETCLELAQKAGEITWARGILVKGGGLCHGIAGNGYLMHNLYRTFKKLSKEEKEKELAREECFSERPTDQKHAEDY